MREMKTQVGYSANFVLSNIMIFRSITSKYTGTLDRYLRTTKIYSSTLTKTLKPEAQQCYECSSKSLEELARQDMIVVNDFITDDEENNLLREIEPKWRRLKYQFDHWDNAIQGFREKEVSRWSPENESILKRVRDYAFSGEDNQRPLVHVLDLAEEGFIKPHVDSVRFCGRIIIGLSLLSSSVMRLVNEEDISEHFLTLINRRSLYIMKDRIRYKFTHEILKTEESIFRQRHIKKGRRISLICRSEPDQELSDSFTSNVKPLDFS